MSHQHEMLLMVYVMLMTSAIFAAWLFTDHFKKNNRNK